MELTAVIRGMEAVKGWVLAGELLEIVSDSQYALGMASGAHSPNANLDLCDQARLLGQALAPRFRWTKGHAGDLWNERCDRLAKRGKRMAVEAVLASGLKP